MASTGTPLTNSTSSSQVPVSLGKPVLAGVILAAGRSSRFGSDKRLAPYNDQHTLLSRSIAVIGDYCSHVFVVTRPGDEDGENLLGVFDGEEHVEQFAAVDALHGMGSSLANGIRRVVAYEQQHNRHFDGVLIMLADMPYVHEDTIGQLIDGYREDKITIPCYLQPHKEKKWGNPVLFSRKWFTALQGLHGDRGAKSLIKANPCARIEVVVEDAGILRDVDTPSDLLDA